MLTVGVEEEFLLLEPGGAVAPVAGDVVRAVGGEHVKPEFMAYQVETATRVCTRLDEVRSEVSRLRRLAAAGAEQHGARLVAAGMPPYLAGPLDEVTAESRYLDLARRFPSATAAAGGACACQVHVGVPDRDAAVEVLARLRPWLRTLLAMSGNSAVVHGADTGWSSYRYRSLLQWPTFRAPGTWVNAYRYDRTVQALLDCGAAVGHAGVYLLARLSARYPTVEVRVADACLTVEDTVLLAAVVRGLVATLLHESRVGLDIDAVPDSRISAGLLAAAYGGLSDDEARSAPGFAVPLDAQLARLYRRIVPALTAFGDADEVRDGFERLARCGTGATRQRRMLAAAATPHQFVDALATASAQVIAVG